MKKLLLSLLIIPTLVFSQSDTTKTEKAFRIVPLITSTPLMGWGFGVSSSFLYDGDESSASKSQLLVEGQYTTTKSYNALARNNLWLKDNSFLSSTQVVFSSINNEFSDKTYGDVEYNINTVIVTELLMFRVANQIYLGTPLSYKRLEYKPNNQSGEDFITGNGITDENSAGIGVAVSYDTRKNKYFPSKAAWITARVNTNPNWLGADNSYGALIVDARYYAKGFKDNDVWASQFYGHYSSDKAPDNGLPTLSGKTQLRGYPAGQFKAKYQTGAQTEYRYTINNTRFRAVAFFGLANLSGGSYGFEGNSRDDDGWYTCEGLGVRYMLQQVTGVDLRLDFVHTSKGDISFYLKVNQAF
ncbi:BamA/TamA family outer membrane protein [Carboxylicivirga marina]|uniref:BamA/TamA family outer membrane protein n=1 Tax=Carboxylicivirga marina TaxID=2800988 RepID=A0ABS1HG25_9BACT|nr:BamA/TamA family outer membrane protein [Carboxylicivirga marina]MBK3516575.1 BamA/TamA family outer membrane protein [Carboxylicivirga marina]